MTMTSYEITVRHTDGRTFLVGYAARHSAAGLRQVIHRRRAAILRVTGLASTTEFDYAAKPRQHYTADGWTIGFTGRTELEAKQQGAHLFATEEA